MSNYKCFSIYVNALALLRLKYIPLANLRRKEGAVLTLLLLLPAVEARFKFEERVERGFERFPCVLDEVLDRFLFKRCASCAGAVRGRVLEAEN